MMPAFTSSSLKFPIAVTSSLLGITPASESFVAFTITITFISLLLWIVVAWRLRDTGDSAGVESSVAASRPFWQAQTLWYLDGASEARLAESISTNVRRPTCKHHVRECFPVYRTGCLRVRGHSPGWRSAFVCVAGNLERHARRAAFG